MSIEYRLPTLGNTRIPIHPEPSFFETTTAIISTGVVDHVEVERVMARPAWDFEEANLRLFKEKKAREAAAAAGEAAKPAKRKTTTAKKAAPKTAPASARKGPNV